MSIIAMLIYSARLCNYVEDRKNVEEVMVWNLRLKLG
jgi:hypothetical protein